MDRSTIDLLHKRGKSLRAIAAELGHSKTTIARALSEPVDQHPARRVPVSVVDPWRSQIAEWLRRGLSGVRMLDARRPRAAVPRVRFGVAGRGATRASGARTRAGRS